MSHVIQPPVCPIVHSSCVGHAVCWDFTIQNTSVKVYIKFIITITLIYKIHTREHKIIVAILSGVTTQVAKRGAFQEVSKSFVKIPKLGVRGSQVIERRSQDYFHNNNNNNTKTVKNKTNTIVQMKIFSFNIKAMQLKKSLVSRPLSECHRLLEVLRGRGMEGFIGEE